jgi:LemA protein
LRRSRQRPSRNHAAKQALQGALVNLNAVAENYPDLKANQNFLNGQEQEPTVSF